MRIIQIINEAAPKVTGTNCGNCSWKKGADVRAVEPSELNSNGGLKIKDKKDLKNAKISDLVTLPGKGTAKTAFFCAHKKVDQWVTDRMCCIYWDAPGVVRDFGEISVD